MKRTAHRRRGWVLADAVMALFTIALALAMFAETQSRITRAARQLADQRIATRAANAALLTLQAGQAIRQDDTPCVIEPIDLPAATGWKWVSVKATHRKATSELVGLVRGQP